MTISVFDLFKIGIGPSSSHTVGPMRAAFLFVKGLQEDQLLSQVAQIKIELYGSLGATGKGHGTDKGILLGLIGETPDSVDPARINEYLNNIRSTHEIALLKQHSISFIEKEHLLFYRRSAMAEHPNGMKFHVFDAEGNILRTSRYLSVGGGFVVKLEEAPNPEEAPDGASKAPAVKQAPYPFQSAKELLALCEHTHMSIAQLVFENEKTWRTEKEIYTALGQLWDVMQACVNRGLGHCNPGEVEQPEVKLPLPGPLKVRRRAPELYKKFSETQNCTSEKPITTQDPLAIMDWISLYAIAVNEENAAGGRVVTAPTNGAAGIIPAVMHYYDRFVANACPQGIVDFLLTAAAIGTLYKLNASISGAEVGCQGEVGVACSMAAGALAAVLGGTPEQIENAAEIGMEHNLGLTCDPVGGLVQIPCIERNAMGAVKAVNAARMALHNDGQHYVSLDSVIKTMRETGADMKTKYKETSRGGLAVNIVEC